MRPARSAGPWPHCTHWVYRDGEQPRLLGNIFCHYRRAASAAARRYGAGVRTVAEGPLAEAFRRQEWAPILAAWAADDRLQGEQPRSGEAPADDR